MKLLIGPNGRKQTAYFLAITLLLSGCQHPKKPALTGRVTSTEEGAMEGVLVSAKSEGSPITVTVVSDATGTYSFPSDRLPEGDYQFAIRATGYVLMDAPEVLIRPERGTQTVVVDLRLKRTNDVASQLTSAEWLESVPGSQQEKSKLYRCVACHELTPVMQSRYDAKSWPDAIKRMERWVPASVIQSPIQSPNTAPSDPPDPALSTYLASINLGGRTSWPYELKPFARPHGAATRVIITEY